MNNVDKLSAIALADFANTLNSGYLKDWKARSMVSTLTSIPDIFTEEGRLEKYVSNCLTMEGFSETACTWVCKWLREWVR